MKQFTRRILLRISLLAAVTLTLVFGIRASVGQRVKAGQKIARVGSTGVATGPHCTMPCMSTAWP